GGHSRVREREDRLDPLASPEAAEHEACERATSESYPQDMSQRGATEPTQGSAASGDATRSTSSLRSCGPELGIESNRPAAGSRPAGRRAPPAPPARRRRRP